MPDYTITLNKDLHISQQDTKVCVTGIIMDRWFHKSRFGIAIADVTGTIRISFTDAKASYDRNSLLKGKRVRIIGCVCLDKNENIYIGKVEKVEVLEEISLLNNELDILDQERLIQLSKIHNLIREQLMTAQFVEISTRVISRRIGDEILEPLLINYPGFGSSIFLSPSPSSQLSEFLAVTMLPKVFTVTTSFSSSYRFPNGSTELPIIMAKAINLSEEEESSIILSTVNQIVETLSDRAITINHTKGEWNKQFPDLSFSPDVFTFTSYETDVPTMGKIWSSLVYMIRCLYDDNENLLLECMHERINHHIDICSITFYPSQFLDWISKAPKRQIQNLWKVFDGGNLYG